MNHTNSLQVPVTKRYKQVLCHSTDFNTSLFSLITKFYDLSDLRRVRTAWLRLLHSGTNDGWLSPFTVCCFGTNSTCISLTASHREHHIATNPDHHSFMVFKMSYTFCLFQERTHLVKQQPTTVIFKTFIMKHCL